MGIGGVCGRVRPVLPGGHGTESGIRSSRNRPETEGLSLVCAPHSERGIDLGLVRPAVQDPGEDRVFCAVLLPAVYCAGIDAVHGGAMLYMAALQAQGISLRGVIPQIKKIRRLHT